jgi:NAD(P)-dependent dehydrogenase (short-subunit alcohol dehydrogenase family)
MDLKLQNKTALVTGSTAGIGFAIALALVQEGATVVLNGRTPNRVAEAVQKIKLICPSAQLIPVPADLSEKQGIEALLREVPTVDILVNNFGVYEVKPFAEISDEDWLHFFEANVLSGVRLSRHYLQTMLKKDWGRIIFISSESGLQIPAEMIHYGVTKTAQLALSRGIAETLAGTQVTANCVLPGPTQSEGVKQFVDNLAAQQNKKPEEIEAEFFMTMRPTSLLKRFITPDEVAALVVFLCSPVSAGTNGAALRVDGGVVRSIA